MENTKGKYTDIYNNEKEIILTDDEMDKCNASLSEQILYYITNPSYFLEKSYESIVTLSWKL
tara:strand:- start:247 stop:432 length:186 start_codon:yes stop_codon:yes gene_type:complete